MKNKNIYILIEYFNREFHSNLLLGILSASKGANVYLGRDQDFKLLLKKNLLNKGIFHTKSVTHGIEKTKFHTELKKKGFFLTCVDQEGTSVHEIDLEEFHIRNRLASEDLKNIDAFFCWGQYDYNRLIKFFPKQKKKFYLTGSPRKDLWISKFNSFWKNSDNNKSDILIISNFSFYNNHLNLKKIFKRKELEGYYSRSKKLKNNELQYYRYQKKNFNPFVNLVKFLSKKFPKKKIIVRPHPTENIDTWEKKLKGLNNIHISNDAIISQQICQSKCVIQNGSASALEAYLFKKPIINFEKYSKNFGYGAFTKKFSNNFKNKEKVLKFIKNLDKKKTLFKADNLVNFRIKFYGKNLASQNILKIWKRLAIKLPPNNNHEYKIKANIFYNDFINLKLKAFILKITGKYHLYNYFLKKFHKIEIEKVADDIDKMMGILKIKNQINVKKLGTSLILINKR